MVLFANWIALARSAGPGEPIGLPISERICRDWSLVAEIVQQDIHAHLAGDLAGGLSAHAVTNDKDAMARIEAKIIFVVRAHAPDVGFAGNFHRKRHMWVPCMKR